MLKPCPVCGVELLGSLADAVADPKQPESCPKTMSSDGTPLPYRAVIEAERRLLELALSGRFGNFGVAR